MAALECWCSGGYTDTMFDKMDNAVIILKATMHSFLLVNWKIDNLIIIYDKKTDK